MPAASVSRSASSTSSTCHRPCVGELAARMTRARISPTAMDSPSGTTNRTSACVPVSAVWQAWHCPQPALGHCSAAANVRAATERPEPGGPVKSQAWVMPWPLSGSLPERTIASAAATARLSVVIASSCPTSYSKIGGVIPWILRCR